MNRRSSVARAGLGALLAAASLGLVVTPASGESSAPPASATNPASWAASLAGSGGHAPAILVVGDSYSEGQGATTPDRTWISLLTQRIEARYPAVTDVAEYVPPWYAVYGTSASWAAAAHTEGSVQQSTDFGQGKRSVVLDAGASATWDVTGAEGVSVVHGTAPGAGTLHVAVDGAEAGTVPATGPTAWTVVSPVRSARSLEQVSVTAQSGPVPLEGIVVRRAVPGRPSGSGLTLTVWNAAHTGATADLVEPGDPMWQGWSQVAPTLVVDELIGGNDYLHSGGTPAQVAQLLSERVARYRELPSRPTVVVLVPFGPQAVATGPTNTLGVGIDQYLAASEAAARAAGATVVDLADLVPDPPADFLDTDGLHPSDVGQQTIAQAVDTALARIVDSEAPGTAISASTSSQAPKALAAPSSDAGVRTAVGGTLAAVVVLVVVLVVRRRVGRS